ncbi:MAG: (d)CMP kinase [Oscillospiraceae bacterium]|nr:(d)CMP kinase [Oscillospiraceae bacterium]
METNSIAIDGPAGAGKSTLSRRVARRFGLIYVDTGALYRCVGLFALRNNVASRDEIGVARLLPDIRVEMKYDSEGIQRMLLCSEDVTEAIRLPEASVYASDVSAMPAVRDYLLSTQREMADKYDVIMDGRDIGTVILPSAGLKVFLTADPEIRARRRYLELLNRGIKTSFEDVFSEMISRDKNDSERAAAPLRVADDAIMLDTTALSFDDSFFALCELISGRFSL